MQRKTQCKAGALPRIGGVVAVAVVGTGLVACSSAPADPAPTVDFSANDGTSVGMAPMTAMTAMPAPAAPSPSVVSTPATGTAVSIENFAFVPPTLTVHRGDTVTWTNHDEEPHTVVADDSSFHSPGMDANGTYSFTFTTAGSFDYICSIHPFMRGTVVVRS